MFKILKQSKISKARLGRLTTNHGVIQTPFFMPDATRAAVRGLASADLARLHLPALVVNTYHLYLQPGTEIIKKAQGVHHFMDWAGPLLSDSGGYQVFSLIHKNTSPHLIKCGDKGWGKITDDKVIFRSPLDGRSHDLTPEKSIQIQFALGVDMMVCLDDCPPNDADRATMLAAMARTVAWAKRCKIEFEKQIKKRNLGSKRPLLFAVIQGGVNLELRKKCFDALEQVGFSAPGGPLHSGGQAAQGWDGYGFGACHVDKDGNFLAEPLAFTADLIPAAKLRFGLGIGAPEDIVRAVRMGWDMFDCVIPTREARHGKLYSAVQNYGISEFQKRRILPNRRNSEITHHTINITNSKYKKDFSPINSSSKLEELRHYTKAYLHHLFKTQERLAERLATLNNLEFYTDLLTSIRQAIKQNRF